MPVWRSKLWTILFAILALSFAGMNAFGQSDADEHVKFLQGTINGSSFETHSGGTTERYKYDRVAFAQCLLSWTEEHESQQGNQLTLREFSETTVSLDVLDLRAIKSEKLKASGFMVSLLTKNLKPGFLSRQRIQWGDEAPTESQGVSTGAAFYFQNRAAADSVAAAITALARSCSPKMND